MTNASDIRLEEINAVFEALRRAFSPLNADAVQASIYLDSGKRLSILRIDQILKSGLATGNFRLNDDGRFFKPA